MEVRQRVLGAMVGPPESLGGSVEVRQRVLGAMVGPPESLGLSRSAPECSGSRGRAARVSGGSVEVRQRV